MSFTDRDKILMQVQKPTRYTGGEVNICKKNPDFHPDFYLRLN